MSNGEITVDILNPQGTYPQYTVACENVAYLASSGVAMLVSECPPDNTRWWERGRQTEMLFGALLLTRKAFPCFSFHPLPIATIHFKNTNLSDVFSYATAVVKGDEDLPCLYDPYMGTGNDSDPASYIHGIRSLDAYIDLFHAPQVPFVNLIESLQAQYRFSDRHFRPSFVEQLYRRLTESSRLVHIATHYFVNAARLIHEHFIEDAGLNLNLVLEAIIEDFAATHDITDKKQAIEALQNTVTLPYGHMEYLEELYRARNEFLAHIDKEMFTETQNINDPDKYCYEHFESVSWLIRRYMKHESAEQPDAEVQSEGAPSDWL